MEVRKNESERIVEVWLTNADQQNTFWMEVLNHSIKEWHRQGYMPVIFRSGTENLADNTYAMLKYNRERAARREAECEKMVESAG